MKKSLLLAGLCAIALGASAQNPFAYDVTIDGIVDGKTETTSIDVTYKLNAPALRVNVMFYTGDTFVKNVEFTTENLLTVGEHTVAVSLDGLQPNTEYRTVIETLGAGVDAPIKVGPTHTFWSPYGIACDNNMESKHYGRVLVTESQPTVNDKTSGYWTSNKLDGVGPGIYEFTPTMERVPNDNLAAVEYGYNGGLTFQAYSYASDQKMFGPKKVRITRDGRIFVGTLDTRDNQPLYEVNPDNLNSWTPFFVGNVINNNDDGTVVDGEGNFVGGPSAAMDFMGEGETLKMVNLSCKGGQVFAYGRFQTYEYPIGKATQWSAVAAPEDEVIPLSMQYTISSQTVNVAYDQDGGIWYAQYRGTPTEAQPAIKHVSKNNDGEWVEDYSDIQTIVRGGGIAFSPDYKYLAIPANSNKLGIYEVTRGNEGMVLNQVHMINTTDIRGFNDIAWDNAYNLYSCDNGKEVFVQFQLPHPNNNITPTNVRSEFNFMLGDLTGVKDINVKDNGTRKYVENGQVVIERNGIKYNIAGQAIK